MRFGRIARMLAMLAACSMPAAVQAQGFGLNEIGTCALSRGFAATGLPCSDASSIYWNPAAQVTPRGVNVYGGLAAVMVRGDFTADTTGEQFEGDAPIETPPHLFLNYRGAGRWSAGVGVYVPYGLTSQWREDFPGRFQALRASLATVYVQPNLAVDVLPNVLSIGGGPIIGHSNVELIQALDLASVPAAVSGTDTTFFSQLGIAPQTEFGRATLEGDAFSYGFHIGAHLRLGTTLTVGARYLSEIGFEYDEAEATFEQRSTGLILPKNNPFGVPEGTPVDAILAPQFLTDSTLASQGVSTRIDHPAQFQLGVAYSGMENTVLSLDYAWIGWSSFRELPVNFEGGAPDRSLIEDYDNSWSVRTGLQHGFGNGWTGRAGLSFVRTPAPDETVTPLLPDQDRVNYNLGVGIPLGERYALDLGYLAVDTQGRRGRIEERVSREQTAAELNTGFFRLTAHVLSLSVRAQF